MTAPDKIWIDASYIDSPKVTPVLCCNLGTSDPANALETDTEYTRSDLIPAMIAEAVAKEREQCATIPAQLTYWAPLGRTREYTQAWLEGGVFVCQSIAAAIRKGVQNCPT